MMPRQSPSSACSFLPLPRLRGRPGGALSARRASPGLRPPPRKRPLTQPSPGEGAFLRRRPPLPFPLPAPQAGRELPGIRLARAPRSAFLHVVPSSRFVPPLHRPPSMRRVPDSRVSRAGAPAPASARFAAARFARLIARARQRAHLSRRLLGGFQKSALPGCAAPGEAAPESASHGTIISQSARCQAHIGNNIQKYRKLFIFQQGWGGASPPEVLRYGPRGGGCSE